MMQTAKNLPADKRRAATVQAVVTLAAEKNPNDISTSAIAAVMGLTQGALFRHFLNKDLMWQSVMEWVADCLLSRVDNVIRSAQSPLAALEAVFMTHMDFVTSHPGVPRILLMELQRGEVTPAKQMAQTLLKNYEERICQLIETGKASGELNRHISTASAATLFVGTIQGLVLRSILADTPSKAMLEAAGVFSVYRRGIEEHHATSV
ncbi:MAG: TetR/AcrR family transcriptional regulator [Trichlorobacter sp.]|uniref:TetR/AcrR family transcriptional regulator n=1 Tax=Trichlorobacter sp. TaxID=2911007 RepID=UPI00256B71B9|nr:TetR/AcrR family transcriptional regulator [Trichlorobacter sp.]MDK9717188.1 TetR/AcrR family transcriptional regulator [Trichlorobacter sp.]